MRSTRRSGSEPPLSGRCGLRKLAPPAETARKYAEAHRLLKDVIAEHPRTPWADLAQDTLDRGFSVVLNEWPHNPKYAERSQIVPRY